MTKLELLDLPSEMLSEISTHLDIKDRLNFMPTCAQVWRATQFWADVDRLEANSMLELHYKGERIFCSWDNKLLTSSFIWRMRKLRVVSLLTNCSGLDSSILPSLRNVEKVVLYNVFFTPDGSAISVDLLTGLLSLPQLRSLAIATQNFPIQTVEASFIPPIIRSINKNITHLHIKGVKIESPDIDMLAEQLPLVSSISIDQISDLQDRFVPFMQEMGKFPNLKNLEVPEIYAERGEDPLTPVVLENQIENMKIGGSHLRRDVEFFVRVLPPSVKLIQLGTERIYMATSAWERILGPLQRPPLLLIIPHREGLVEVRSACAHSVVVAPRFYRMSFDEVVEEVAEKQISPGVFMKVWE